LSARNPEDALGDQVGRGPQIQVIGLDFVLGLNDLGQDAGIRIAVRILRPCGRRLRGLRMIMMLLQNVGRSQQLLEGCFVEERSSFLAAVHRAVGRRFSCRKMTHSAPYCSAIGEPNAVTGGWLDGF